jgi:hypothetical protein
MPRDLVLHLSADRPPEELTIADWIALAATELGVDAHRIAITRVVRTSLDARRQPARWRVALRAWEAGDDAPSPTRSTPAVPARPAQGAPHVVSSAADRRVCSPRSTSCGAAFV